MRSRSRSSLRRLRGGESLVSLASPTRRFFWPVAAFRVQSSPCSPESSRWMKERVVLSGAHWMDSGARPVMPPSAKAVSIVRGFCGDWARARGTNGRIANIQRQRRFTRVSEEALSLKEKCNGKTGPFTTEARRHREPLRLQPQRTPRYTKDKPSGFRDAESQRSRRIAAEDAEKDRIV